MTEVPCELHKKSIINTIIRGVDETIFQNDGQIIERFDEENEYLDHLSSPFTVWLDKIVETVDLAVKESDDGDRDNLMYQPTFAKDFVRLCKILPLWSAISNDLFEIDEVTNSSSNVESDFKNIKQSLADVIPCSVDTFVEKHIDLLKGATIEASQQGKYLKFIQEESNEKDCDQGHSNQTETISHQQYQTETITHAVSEMQYNEGWNKSQKKTTSNYMRPAPNWNLNNNIAKRINFGILVNGNLSNITHKVGRNHTIALTNTNSFDAICQVSAVLKKHCYHRSVTIIQTISGIGGSVCLL